MPHTESQHSCSELVQQWVEKLPEDERDDGLVRIRRMVANALDNGNLELSPTDLQLWRWDAQQMIDNQMWHDLKRERRVRPLQPGTQVWLKSGSPSHSVISDDGVVTEAVAWVGGQAERLALPRECWAIEDQRSE